MNTYEKTYLMGIIMFLTSFAAMFFLDADMLWWGFAHFVLSFIIVIVSAIAKCTSGN